jgi:hypothetical protein
MRPGAPCLLSVFAHRSLMSLVHTKHGVLREQVWQKVVILQSEKDGCNVFERCVGVASRRLAIGLKLDDEVHPGSPS